MVSIVPSIPSSKFFCTFSAVYLGKEARPLDHIKDRAAILEAAKTIPLVSSNFYKSLCLWGVSGNREWAVFFMFSNCGNLDQTCLFVRHGVTSTCDLLSKHPFDHLAKGTLKDDILIPRGPVICLALCSTLDDSSYDDDYHTLIKLLGHHTHIAAKLIRVTYNSPSAYFTPKTGSSSLFLVIYTTDYIRNGSCDADTAKSTSSRYGFGSLNMFDHALGLEMEQLDPHPKPLPPLDVELEAAKLEAAKADNLLQVLTAQQKEAGDRLAVAKAQVEEMKANIAAMDAETKELETRVEAMKRELVMKALRKNGLDVDRKQLEIELCQESNVFRSTITSASTSTLTEPVGLRGLLDCRKKTILLSPIT